MPARTVLGGLLIGSLDEFGRVIDAIPAPGRQRRLGRLNAPAWTIAHTARSVDSWVNVCVQRLAPEPMTDDVYRRQRVQPPGIAVDVDFDAARDAYGVVVATARGYVELADAAVLAREASLPPGSPWTGAPAAYLVARAIAHVYAHAGELAVAASLVGAPDLALPGALPCARAAAAVDGSDGPALARLEIVVGAANPQPKPVRKLDPFLGRPLAPADIDGIAALVQQQTRPNEAVHGSVDWRRSMAGVLTRRALTAMATA